MTDRRVVIISGIAIKSDLQIRLKDIRSLAVTKSGFAAIFFDVGSVVISSAATDDDEIVISGINNVTKVRDTISGLQDRAG